MLLSGVVPDVPSKQMLLTRLRRCPACRGRGSMVYFDEESSYWTHKLCTVCFGNISYVCWQDGEEGCVIDNVAYLDVLNLQRHIQGLPVSEGYFKRAWNST